MFCTNVDLLKKIIADRGKTLEGLAGDLNVNRSTLYRRIINNRLLLSDVQKIAAVLHLSRTEICDIFLAEQVQICTEGGI